MLDALLTDEDKALREEVRRFVAEEVSPELVRQMDAEVFRLA